MILKHWNIWHNRSSYYDRPVELHSAAAKLVDSGLCKLVYHTDGVAYWKHDNRVEADFVPLEIEGHSRLASATFPEDMKGYELEGLYQSITLRYNEVDIFSDFAIQNLTYVRGFLGLCVLTLGEKSVLLYPQIKMYGHGVFTISFRIIGNGLPYDIDELIDTELNLFRHNTVSLEVPPEVLSYDGRDYLLTERVAISERRKRVRALSETLRTIDTNSRTLTKGDFEFQLCPVDPSSLLEEPELNLDCVWHYITGAITAVISEPREGASYIWRNARGNSLQVGGFWSSRPETYVITFEDQPESAREVETDFSDDITKLLMRVTETPRADTHQKTLESLRVYDDFCLYANEGGGLCVYARKGLDNNGPWKDENFGHLIYPIQVRGEYVNLIYMSYHQLQEHTLACSKSLEAISENRQRLLDLNRQLSKISTYGEINDYFEYVWKQLNIDTVEKDIRENVSLTTDRLKHEHSERIIKFGWVLAVVFGIVGVSSLTDQVVFPLWSHLGLWLPTKTILQMPFMTSITGLLVLLMIIAAYRVIVRKRRI